jgi:hypothetical protein
MFIFSSCFFDLRFSDPGNAVEVTGIWDLDGKVSKDGTTIKGSGELWIEYQDKNYIEGFGKTAPLGNLLTADTTGTITDKPDNLMTIYISVEYPPLSGKNRNVYLRGNVTESATGVFVDNGIIYLDDFDREIGSWTGVLTD